MRTKGEGSLNSILLCMGFFKPVSEQGTPLHSTLLKQSDKVYFKRGVNTYDQVLQRTYTWYAPKSFRQAQKSNS